MARFRRGVLYRQFLLAFLIVGVIPAVVGIVQYQQARRLASDFITESKQSILQLGRDLVVRQLREVQALTVHLGEDLSVLAPISYEGPVRGPVLTQIQEAQELLAASQPTGDVVSRLWVYYPLADSIVGSRGVYTRLREKYGVSCEAIGLSYKEFRRYLLDVPPGGGLLPPISLSLGAEDLVEQVIPYARRIHRAGSRGAVAVVLALLNENAVADIFADLYADDGAFFALKQDDRAILTRPRRPSMDVGSLLSRTAAGETICEAATGRRQILVFQAASDAPVPLEYAAGVPVAVAMRPFVRTGRLVLATLALAVLLHFVLSVVLSRRLAEPVATAIDRLSARTYGDTDASGSGSLNRLLDQLFDRTTDLEARLAEHRTILSDTYFRMALEGTLQKVDVPRQVLDAVALLRAERFRVVLFRVTAEVAPDHEVEMMNSGGVYVRHILGSAKGVRVFSPRPDAVGALFYAGSSETSRSDGGEPDVADPGAASAVDETVEGGTAGLARRIEMVAQDLLAGLAASDDTNAVVAVGREVSDVGFIHQSYEDALSLFDVDPGSRPDQVLWYDRATAGEGSYVLSSGVLVNLRRWIRGGNVERIRETFDRIRRASFERPPVSADDNLLIVRELAIALAKTVKGLATPDSRLDADLIDTLTTQALYSNSRESPARQLETLRDWYCSVAGVVSGTESPQQPELGRLAQEYVEDNFCDASITLSSVAESFGVSPAHLSRVFSKTVKMPFQVYLTQTRLQEAKSLLSSSDADWSDVYARVGYTNLNTFRRAFQKYEGVTPIRFARRAARRRR